MVTDYVIQNVSAVPSSNNILCGSLRKSVVTNSDEVEDASNVLKAVTPAKESDFLYQLVQNYSRYRKCSCEMLSLSISLICLVWCKIACCFDWKKCGYTPVTKSCY